MIYACYHHKCIDGAASLCILKIKYGINNIIAIPTSPNQGILEYFDPTGKTIFFVDVVPSNFDFFAKKAAKVVVLDHHESNKYLKEKKYPPHVKILISDKGCGARLVYHNLMKSDKYLNILTGLIDVHDRWLEEKFEKWNAHTQGVYAYVRGKDGDLVTNFYRLYNQMKMGTITLSDLKRRGQKEISIMEHRCKFLENNIEHIKHSVHNGMYIEINAFNDWEIRSDVGHYFLTKYDISFVILSKYVPAEDYYYCSFRSLKNFNILTNLKSVPNLKGHTSAAGVVMSYDEIDHWFDFVSKKDDDDHIILQSA